MRIELFSKQIIYILNYIVLFVSFSSLVAAKHRAGARLLIFRKSVQVPMQINSQITLAVKISACVDFRKSMCFCNPRGVECAFPRNNFAHCRSEIMGASIMYDEDVIK